LTEQARNYKESWKTAIKNNPDFMINLLMDIKQEMTATQGEK
jgi:hypothetical protein